MAVPYTFATATSSLPLSQLDSNFATPITLGTTSVYLGSTYSTIANLTLSTATLNSPTINNALASNLSVYSVAGGTTLSVYYNGSTGGGAEVRVWNGYTSVYPIYAFLSNDNTGIGNPASNAISFIIANSESARFDPYNNFLLGLASAPSSASQNLVISNGVAPTSNVAGGSLYVVGGALYYRGSSGTVTKLANA